MQEIKVVWGKKANEQKQQMLGSSNPHIRELIDRSVRYMSTLHSPLYYDIPEGWFTKTTWNKWGEGVEMTARVDFNAGFLFIMEIRERDVTSHLSSVRVV